MTKDTTKGGKTPHNANEPRSSRFHDNEKLWERVMYLILALTVAGQVIINMNALAGQTVWLVANVLAVTRNVMLKRPASDMVKDVCMLGITAGLIAAILGGAF